MALTFAQLEQLWTQAGGASQYAPTAAGIALAESGGNPTAWNKDSATGDNSVGLFQINYFGDLAPSRTAQFGPPQGLTDPLANAKAAVALSGNGATWSPWTSDPVGNAAIASKTPLSASQVQAILSSSGRSTGGTGSTPQTATLTAATTTTTVPGSMPNPDAATYGGLGLTNIGGDLHFLTDFAGWTIFTALIFLLGVTLLLLGAIMLGVVLLGPVIRPAAGLVPGPVGRLARSGKGSSVGAPARTVATVGGGRSRARRSSTMFDERRALNEQRHEHRMTEIEHRGSVRRSNMGRPRSSEDIPYGAGFE